MDRILLIKNITNTKKMKKAKFYTKDFPRFKSHKWKMTSC